MADDYSNFSALAARKQEGTHFKVRTRRRNSDFLVAAPHGGCTEPHTSRIAMAVAGDRHSLYIFDALAKGLHITSSRFDEPRGVQLARDHSKVLTVHGCQDGRSSTVNVFVGGLDIALRDDVIEQLQAAGFTATIDRRTAGSARRNLCNGGRSGAGVQLEITRRLRNRPGQLAERRSVRTASSVYEGCSAGTLECLTRRDGRIGPRSCP